MLASVVHCRAWYIQSFTSSTDSMCATLENSRWHEEWNNTASLAQYLVIICQHVQMYVHSHQPSPSQFRLKRTSGLLIWKIINVKFTPSLIKGTPILHVQGLYFLHDLFQACKYLHLPHLIPAKPAGYRLRNIRNGPAAPTTALFLRSGRKAQAKSGCVTRTSVLRRPPLALKARRAPALAPAAIRIWRFIAYRRFRKSGRRRMCLLKVYICRPVLILN